MKLDFEFDTQAILSVSLLSKHDSQCSRTVQRLNTTQGSFILLVERSGGPGKVHRLGEPASVVPDFCSSDTVIKLEGISAYV